MKIKKITTIVEIHEVPDDFGYYDEVHTTPIATHRWHEYQAIDQPIQTSIWQAFKQLFKKEQTA